MIRRHALAFLCLLSLAIGCEKKSSDSTVDIDKVLANAPRFPVGHKVRIRSTPATQAAGVDGRTGNLAGYTTPSMTGLEVIGEIKDDVAFGVEFKNPHTQLWFAPELLEFLDRTSDLEIQIYGKRWQWRADGSLAKSPA
jgi:hypothetical protein